MYERCITDGEFKQVIGLAIEGRRLDVVERAVQSSSDAKVMLAYAFEVGMTLVANRTFRDQLVQLLARLYRALSVPEYSSLCQCLVVLGDAEAVAELLVSLASAGGSQKLLAYQIAFDLYERARQRLRSRVS